MVTCFSKSSQLIAWYGHFLHVNDPSSISSWVGGGGNQGTRLYIEAGYFHWSCSRKEDLTRKGGLPGRDSREQEQERDSWSLVKNN